MQWLFIRIKAVRAALGRKQTWLAPIFGAVSTFVTWVYQKLEGPYFTAISPEVLSYAVGVIICCIFIIYFLVEYIAKVNESIEGALYELAKLRVEGVKLRNDGCASGVGEIITVTDLYTIGKWEDLILEWNDKVQVELAKVSKGHALWFSVLDIIPTKPRVKNVPYLNDRHRKALREHDARVKRLGDMIVSVWKYNKIGEVYRST